MPADLPRTDVRVVPETALLIDQAAGTYSEDIRTVGVTSRCTLCMSQKRLQGVFVKIWEASDCIKDFSV